MEFDNLHLTDSLKQAKDALFDLCGIYAIKCLKTGALYIGSSTNRGERMVSRILNYSSNLHLQRAIALYGLPCFVFIVVELSNPSVLLTREQYWLDWLFSKPAEGRFNFSPSANSCLGVKHSDETKKLMSDAKKGD